MIRKRGVTTKVAFIGALALSLGVASSALATTEPPSTEPAGSDAPEGTESSGGGAECPRDIVLAAAEEAAAETTVPATTEAPAATDAPAATEAPATTEAPAPEETGPAPTLPENVSELDSNVTIDINTQPRESLQQGGEFRQAVSSLADNWNPLHVDGNEGDYSTILGAMAYTPWTFDAGAAPTLDTNYVLDFAESEDHLTLTYTLNPEAKWHSGAPITWADYAAMWEVSTGLNPEYQVVSTEGFDLITSVEQGVDEFEVVVSLCEPYADYEALFFLGGPAESMGGGDAEAFNTGWIGPINNDWMTGPFKVGNYDDGQEIVELVPDENWWGNAPLLDKLIYRVVTVEATPQSFANNEIDTFDIGPDPNGFALAFNTPNALIRAAAGPNWRHVTMNSGPNGGLIQDQAVRQAIQLSLDRGAIGVSDLAGIPWPAKPLGNHIFVENSQYYVDNAGEYGTYNPEAAGAVLDEAGWVMGGDGVREKDGQRLHVLFAQLEGVPVSANESQLVQAQLAEVGIEVEIVVVPTDDFSETLSTGNFELIAFTWLGTPFPFRGVQQLYGTGSASNYGYSTIPETDALIDQLAVTLDEVERAAIANEIDVLLWEYGHTIPLYQRPELTAVTDGIANFGSFGFASVIWEDIGYVA